jgi:ribonucleoside-diphosphate reductase alpha chain
MYKKSEVELVAKEYFKDNLAASVWLDKYALKVDEDNFIELSPDDTIMRITDELCRIEKNYRNPVSHIEIYGLLSGYNKFVLGGSCLFGIGNNLTLSTLGNCFVIPSPLDSYGGIFKTDQELAQLMKRRGGIGVDISTLRPKKSRVSNAANTSTGTISFMNRFSNTTREVAQEGRRGALIITMDINHPDIMEFITSKDDLTKITGANISVKVTDEFMSCVEKDENYSLLFPTEPTEDYASIEVTVKARSLWDKLIHQSWKTGEPGILFWDRIIEESPADCYEGFNTQGVNPCGELPLCSYDSCRLSAINLYAYVRNPFTKDAYFDFELLEKDAKLAQRLMDDVIDLEHEKIHKIIDKILKDTEPEDIKQVELNLWNEIHNKLMVGRRTGLGQMGLADAGAALGFRYGSDEFIKFSENASRIIAINSYMSSIDLAEERGAFIKFDRFKEINNSFIKRILGSLPIEYLKKYDNFGRRNIANLTIAPTGSISILSGVSSGIEPVFALSYTRKRKVTEDNPNKRYKDKQGDWWEEYIIYHPKFKEWLLKTTFNESIQSDDFLQRISDQFYMKEVYKESPWCNSIAHEINPDLKLLLQSKIQPWIDHSISVTYNFPKSTTEKEISDLYFNAWKLGLKGLTIYRDGCREGILTINKPTFKPGSFNQYDAPKRPKDLLCDIYNIMAKGRSWKVFVGLMDNIPYEIFAVNGTFDKIIEDHGILRKIKKSHYDLISLKGDIIIENITSNMTPDEEVLTRVISWALRHGSKLEFGVEQLNKSNGDITSFSKAIARTLHKYIKDGYISSNNNCPTCNSNLISEGGCLVCKTCGFSKCG